MTHITKTATNRDAFRRGALHTRSAREAFGRYLHALALPPGRRVLMPAFIGWSPREGSGVFDPVEEAGVEAVFYALDDRLHVDVADYAAQLDRGDIGLVVLIHYFGYVDPAYEEMLRLARHAGVPVLEDEAHALFTDLATGRSGRGGDAAILSLHKMLPFTDGGILLLNHDHGGRFDLDDRKGDDARTPWAYDLHAIARARQQNADRLDELLAPHRALVEPLWPDRTPGDVPQTYPVLIHGVSRFALYERMNADGFGVVALYHTLIDHIDEGAFPASHRVAGTIMNLPVHQDVSDRDLVAMVDALLSHIADLGGSPSAVSP